MSDNLDIISEAYERITEFLPKGKTWYVSKLAEYDENGTPDVMFSSDGEMWLRPDIWKDFLNNSWLNKKEE